MEISETLEGELGSRLLELEEFERVVSSALLQQKRSIKAPPGFVVVAAAIVGFGVIALQVANSETLSPLLVVLAVVMLAGVAKAIWQKNVFGVAYYTLNEYLSLLIDFYEPRDRDEWMKLLSARDEQGNIPLDLLSAFVKREKEAVLVEIVDRNKSTAPERQIGEPCS